MYVLLNMGILQPAILVYQRVDDQLGLIISQFKNGWFLRFSRWWPQLPAVKPSLATMSWIWPGALGHFPSMLDQLLGLASS